LKKEEPENWKRNMKTTDSVRLGRTVFRPQKNFPKTEENPCKSRLFMIISSSVLQYAVDTSRKNPCSPPREEGH